MSPKRTTGYALIRLALAGLATTLVLLSLDAHGVGRAVREFFLQQYQVLRAYETAPQAIDEGFFFVYFDEHYCVNRGSGGSTNYAAPEDTACVIGNTPSREDMASVVETLAALEAPPRAIVIDFTFADAGCGAETLRLSRAILSAARRSSVFMLRTISGPVETPLAGATIFDHCASSLAAEELAFLSREARLYFGWANFNSDPRRGFVEMIRPWRQVDAGNDRSPLLASLPFLMAAEREGLIETLESSNFYVRHGLPEAQDPGAELRLCSQRGRTCDYEVGSNLSALPPEMRVSFRLPPIEAQSPEELRHWHHVIQSVSALYFRPNTLPGFVGSGLKPNPIVFIGASAPAYRDVHATPIGRLPGALMIANAYVDFRDGTGLIERPFASVLKDELWSLFGILFVVFVSIWAIWRFSWFGPRGQGKLWDWEPGIIWPIVVLCASVLCAWLYWSEFRHDVRNGVLSFAILSFAASAFEVARSIYDGLAPSIAGAIQAFGGFVWKKTKPIWAVIKQKASTLGKP